MNQLRFVLGVTGTLALMFVVSTSVSAQFVAMPAVSATPPSVGIFPVVPGAPDPIDSLSASLSPNCPGVTHTLRYGDKDFAKGNDVSKLQNFLRQQKAYVGAVNGTFDLETMRSFHIWELENGIILPEDPLHVGSGLSPKALKALQRICEGKPIKREYKDTLVVDDEDGRAPYTITFNYKVNRWGSCDAGSYLLAFGDEKKSGAEPEQIPYRDNVCNPYWGESVHTYTQPGLYNAELRDENGQLIESVPITISR